MKTIFNEHLPNGYYFVEKTSINPADIIKLRESIGWDKGGSADDWVKYVDQSLATICVQDSDGKLVGAALLVGNTRHAVFCDFTVGLAHQHKGIGNAIMTRIMQQIELLKISYVYAELAETNPFREKMMQSGFKMTGNSLFLES